MLRANNPDIDFETLNRRIQTRLDDYAQMEDNTATLFDPEADYPVPEEESVTSVQAAADPDPTALPLVALHDEQFVEQAYRQVLGREADPAGRDHYLAKLRNGEDKRKLLAQLRYSAEGRQQSRAFNAGVNLRLVYLKEGLFRLPLLGRCLAFMSALLGTVGFRRHENAQFNHFYRLFAEQQGQMDTLRADLGALRADLDAQRTDHDVRINLARSQLAQEQQKLEGVIAASVLKDNELNAQFANVDAQASSHDRGLSQLRLRLNDLERSPVIPVERQGGAELVANPQVSSSLETPVEDAFYAAFEEHFRGSAETIRQRLEYYLPLLKRCELLQAGERIADIGCGRGEWLNLLADQGYERFGIDLNRHNVEGCIASGHDAILGDGLAWLQSQSSNSLGAISSFHVIEHLTFAQLNLFLLEALRVLKPGGMIILETPNPENLVTGATNFYMDPTHLHPLPPAFTDFLLSYRGFSSTEIHRLNPIPAEYALLETTEVERRCNQLFYGPQDYAVVAFKSL